VTLTRKGWQKVERLDRPPGFQLGEINGNALVSDPKHLGFTLARYKFAAKMLRANKEIVEIGCGEGLGAFFFVRETQARYLGIDFDEKQIDYAKTNVVPHGDGRVEFICQDVIATPLTGVRPDGIVSLDVVEHIASSEEDTFYRHIFSALPQDGVAIIGTPSKLAESYASEASREGHINLYDPDRLIATLQKYFRRVFLFSMNDEMVHTGFKEMAHYLMALCVAPIRPRKDP
jgi:cyclopropane fatty-acyl-phospholipid synthase-like methyltransferase